MVNFELIDKNRLKGIFVMNEINEISKKIMFYFYNEIIQCEKIE